MLMEYEVLNKPYFGSTKRAKAALAKARVPEIPPKEFVRTLRKKYRRHFLGVQKIRFFRWEDKIGRWRLAILNTIPNPQVRDELFALREEITALTGWYPVVQGAYAEIAKLPVAKSLFFGGDYRAKYHLGDLGHLRPLAFGNEEGTSFLLEGKHRSICLDFGHGGMAGVAQTGTGFGFLSHFHSDHSGGLHEFLNRSSANVLMSLGTYSHLYQAIGPESQRDFLAKRTRVFRGDKSIDFQDGSRIEWFPIFHCPGAGGFFYKDSRGKAVVYLGDVCLRNSFLDFRAILLDRIASLGRCSGVVLLDAALAGRKNLTVDLDDKLGSVLEGIISSLRKRTVIFLSRGVESLVYTYVKTFHTLISAGLRTPILVPEELFIHLRVLWKGALFRWNPTEDPVLNLHKKRDFVNFAESQQLFPLTVECLESLPERPVIIFAGTHELGIKGLAERVKASDVILTSQLALEQEAPAHILSLRPRSILRAANPDWSFHSQESDLAAFIKSCNALGYRVWLFHNYKDRLERFVRGSGIDQKWIIIDPKASLSLEDITV